MCTDHVYADALLEIAGIPPAGEWIHSSTKLCSRAMVPLSTRMYEDGGRGIPDLAVEANRALSEAAVHQDSQGEDDTRLRCAPHAQFLPGENLADEYRCAFDEL